MTDNQFIGQIDRAEIHDHALTPEEIASIYREQLMALEPIFYWPGMGRYFQDGEWHECDDATAVT